jgi:DNA polymerase III gamma/tau subunit
MELKLADRMTSTGYTLQQFLLLQALERQATTGRLMTNPRVTGFTSFAKAVLNFINDKKAPKTCKNLYNYLVANGYYIDIHAEQYNRKV